MTTPLGSQGRYFFAVVGQFEFRFTGSGPNMSLKNIANTAKEIIAAHHGLSTIGNNAISRYAHQGTCAHRLVPEFVGFASSIDGKEYSRIAVRFKGKKPHGNGLEFQTDPL
jgi:hypothetical protein